MAQCSGHSLLCFYCSKYEPIHDKTNNVVVRPAKTQISLGICPVWSESSLSAWRKLGSLATHWAYSEDPDQTGRMPRLIWVFDGRTCHFVGFVMGLLLFGWNISPCPRFWWNTHNILKNEWHCQQKVLLFFSAYLISRVSYYIGACTWQNQQYDLWTQPRFRSAWASAQSAQSRRCSCHETLGP